MLSILPGALYRIGDRALSANKQKDAPDRPGLSGPSFLCTPRAESRSCGPKKARRSARPHLEAGIERQSSMALTHAYLSRIAAEPHSFARQRRRLASQVLSLTRGGRPRHTKSPSRPERGGPAACIADQSALAYIPKGLTAELGFRVRSGLLTVVHAQLPMHDRMGGGSTEVESPEWTLGQPCDTS